MSIVHLTEASSGAPTLSGTDGALVAILDWALVQNGWAIEFTSGTDRVYRPGSGNRFRLVARDASAISGSPRLSLIRGAENASAATTWTDPFPTAAKVADGLANWWKSSTSDGTARNYDLYVAPTWVMMFTNAGGLTNIWEFHFFGDVPPALAGDAYNTAVACRNNSGTGGTATNWSTTSSSTGILAWNWCRSYDGTVKSTTAAPFSQSNGTFGTIANCPQAQAGPSGGVDRIKVPIIDTGTTTTTSSTTLSLPIRGYLPNLWAPLHNGRNGLNTRDTFTDTTYNGSAVFRVFCIANAGSSGFLIVEESDTWIPPSG
jgi:hypothetical protein